MRNCPRREECLRAKQERAYDVTYRKISRIGSMPLRIWKKALEEVENCAETVYAFTHTEKG